MHEDEEVRELTAIVPPKPRPLVVGKRNTAAHQFRVRAADIAKMSQKELNASQRGARKAARRPGARCATPRRQPPRRVPASRSAAEAAPCRWAVAARGGRRGARSALPSGQPVLPAPPPLASGACWWPWDAEAAGRGFVGGADGPVAQPDESSTTLGDAVPPGAAPPGEADAHARLLGGAGHLGARFADVLPDRGCRPDGVLPGGGDRGDLPGGAGLSGDGPPRGPPEAEAGPGAVPPGGPPDAPRAGRGDGAGASRRRLAVLRGHFLLGEAVLFGPAPLAARATRSEKELHGELSKAFADAVAQAVCPGGYRLHVASCSRPKRSKSCRCRIVGPHVVSEGGFLACRSCALDAACSAV